MRLVIFALALCQLSIQDYICNKGTTFECTCADCWSTVSSTDHIDWLSVGLSDCPPALNETKLREKLAGWINEECGASLHCNLPAGLSANNILIGQFTCENSQKEFRIVAFRNITKGLTEDNVLPASTLGQVLQSREHLLSFLLHSELHSVTIHRRFRGSTVSTPQSLRLSLILFTSVFVVFLIVIAVIVYFTQIYINWKRIVKGKWESKQYSKVPNVRYSMDEIESSGHI